MDNILLMFVCFVLYFSRSSVDDSAGSHLAVSLVLSLSEHGSSSPPPTLSFIPEVYQTFRSGSILFELHKRIINKNNETPSS